MELGMFFVYTLIGMFISVPYCFLAGWSWEQWPIVVFVAPIFMFVWIVLGVLAGHIYSVGFSWTVYKHMPRIPYSKGVFYFWTFYCFLPIIIRWVSALIDVMGYQHVANLLNFHRYATPAYVFIFLVCSLLLFGVVAAIVEVLKTGYEKLSRRIKQ